MKKAIFLGAVKIHSSKTGKDFRKVDLFTPPFKDGNGFTRGGVQTYFLGADSTIGDGINVGALVFPEIEYDPYSDRATLVGVKQVAPSPYKEGVFD